MRITGERPVDGVTPDGLVALHRSGYLEAARRMGPGLVLDIGCGVGFGTAILAGDGRVAVGADYDLGAARLAATRLTSARPTSTAASNTAADTTAASTTAAASTTTGAAPVTCMDGGRLGLRGGRFDFVVSSHIIEHFADPAVHAAEVARVLTPEGTAFVFTPNRPADLENPFHLTLFDPAGFRALLERYFADVWVGGHDATPTVKADFATRRRAAQRLLRLDVFGLRHRLPRSVYVRAYGVATRALYRIQARRHAGGATAITTDDFFATDDVDATTLSLFAVARRPRA